MINESYTSLNIVKDYKLFLKNEKEGYIYLSRYTTLEAGKLLFFVKKKRAYAKLCLN
jgi:hypothetical protein